MTTTWNHTTEIGTPVYAIDDRQNVVRGTFYKGLPTGEVEILTTNGVRVFHARYVVVDLWRALENLP